MNEVDLTGELTQEDALTSFTLICANYMTRRILNTK